MSHACAMQNLVLNMGTVSSRVAALKQKEDWDDRPESLILVPNQASDQRFFDASGLVLLSDLRC
eukprot:133070-Rhodomonas_salina.1